jgi:hypothetical protein
VYDRGGEAREFVFEKTGLYNSIQTPLALKDPKEKEYKIHDKAENNATAPNSTDQEATDSTLNQKDEMDLSQSHFDCSTDDDSSDYYDSE